MDNNDGIRVHLSGEDSFCDVCQYAHGTLDFSELDGMSLDALESIDIYVFPRGISHACYELMLGRTQVYVNELEEQLESGNDDD